MSDAPLVLQGALTRIASRLRWRQAARTGALALATLFCTGMTAVVLGAILAPTSLAGWPYVLGAIVAAGIVVVWVGGIAKRVGPQEAAAHADAAAGLHDELKSSLWFGDAGQASAWAELHGARAARTASTLDPARVVPIGMPPAGWAALALGVAFAGIAWWSPHFTPHFSGRSHEPAPNVARAPVQAREAEHEVEAAARAGGEAARARLEAALAAVNDPNRSAAERRQALEAARQLAARRALEAAATAERLRTLAEALATRKGMEGVTEALKRGDARAAAEALRESQGAAAADRPEGGADGVARTPAEDEALAAAVKESLEKSDTDPTAGEGSGRTDGRLAKAVQNLEEIAKRLEASQLLNNATRRLSDMSAAINRTGGNLRAARFGQQQGNANASESSDTGESDIRGGHMFRLGAVAKEDKPPGDPERARAGDASGNARGDPVVGDEVSRFRAKLERTTVKGRESEAPESADSAFYAASRQGEAKVAYQAVAARYRQVGEEVLGVERIALRDRAQVRQFFSDNPETAK